MARVLSYAVAAGLYAAAAIFAMAALMVGATAGFRWIEMRYGLFEAFGALAALLVIFMALFVILALYALKRAAKRVAPLSSKLRVALGAPPSIGDVGAAATVASLPTRRRGLVGGSTATALAIALSLIGCMRDRGQDSWRRIGELHGRTIMPAGTIGRLPGVAHRYVGVGLWRKADVAIQAVR